MTMKPDDAMSLAERIEGIATESGLASWTVKDLRAIADELREIAESANEVADLLGAHLGRSLKPKDQSIYADRLYAIGDRLAGKEGT